MAPKRYIFMEVWLLSNCIRCWFKHYSHSEKIFLRTRFFFSKIFVESYVQVKFRCSSVFRPSVMKVYKWWLKRIASHICFFCIYSLSDRYSVCMVIQKKIPFTPAVLVIMANKDSNSNAFIEFIHVVSLGISFAYWQSLLFHRRYNIDMCTAPQLPVLIIFVFD